MANDTNLVYTRTMEQTFAVRGANVVITTRQGVVRIDPRTGQEDLTTRSMVETIQVRPIPELIWNRSNAAP